MNVAALAKANDFSRRNFVKIAPELGAIYIKF